MEGRKAELNNLGPKGWILLGPGDEKKKKKKNAKICRAYRIG